MQTILCNGITNLDFLYYTYFTNKQKYISVLENKIIHKYTI
jgi:hypothetical protein